MVQVHDLQKTYRMAPRTVAGSKEEFFRKRYRQIRHYEEYLYENSYRVLKIFLHVSKEEQKKRFLERIDDPEKNWKFSEADLKERARFEEYLDTYAEVQPAHASRHGLVRSARRSEMVHPVSGERDCGGRAGTLHP